MRVDIILPLVFGVSVVLSLHLYPIVEKRWSMTVGEEMTLGIRTTTLMAMSIFVTAYLMLIMPELMFQVLTLGLFALLLGVFAYILYPDLRLTVIPPAVFLVAYFKFWTPITYNLFVLIIAATYSSLLSLFIKDRKPLAAFAAVICVIDFIHVMVTRVIIEAAQQALRYRIPTSLLLPTFPSPGMSALGVGDLFFAGIIAVNIARIKDRKTSLLSVVLMTLLLFLFTTILFNLDITAFPATLPLAAGSFPILLTKTSSSATSEN